MHNIHEECRVYARLNASSKTFQGDIECRNGVFALSCIGIYQMPCGM